jgi:hypothetical protein
VSLLTLYGVNLSIARRADALLREARGLRTNGSSEQDTLAVLDRFGPEEPGVASGFCISTTAGRSVVLGNDTLNWLGRESRLLRPFGNGVWSVEVTVLTENGRVCSVLYYVQALRSDENWEVTVQATDVGDPSSRMYGPTPYDTSVRVYKGTIGLSVKLTPQATAEQREHALGFDLSCLTRFAGCQQPCGLLPSAWLDYQREAHENGWEVPPEDVNDQRCKSVQ